MSDEGHKNKQGLKRIEELIEYFETGKRFTEELMKENERLRLRSLQLEKEKLELVTRTDVAALLSLQEENRALKEKLYLIESKFGEVERENQDFAERYVSVQAQNDNLLNLYVASYQLHANLDPSEVVQVIQEIILNLIGAEEYFICMKDPRTGWPSIMAGEGPDGPLPHQSLPAADPDLKEVLKSGRPYFREADQSSSPHLACTPLKVKDEVVGAISISKLLDQKKAGLSTIDHELLGLMSDHAAVALVSSNLYSRTRRKLRTVEGFLELLKTDGIVAAPR